MVPDALHDVYGIVYEMDLADMEGELDSCEGFLQTRPATHNAYNRQEVVVEVGGKEVLVWIYLAVKQDPGHFPPSHKYLVERIIAGAVHWGISAEYVDSLRTRFPLAETPATKA